MDITPQLIRETTFHESLRGYNRDEVEDYKHRWAEAVAQLQGRLIEAVERAERAESRAIAASGRSESEEAFRRTLLLAQRTADQAIEEANVSSEEIVGAAQSQASGILDEAQARARRMLDHADREATNIRSHAQAEAKALADAADVEAREVIEAARGTILDDVKSLESRKQLLSAELATIEEELSQRREDVAVAVAMLGDTVALHRSSTVQELAGFRGRVLEELDSLTRIYAARNDALEKAATSLRTGLDQEALRARVSARVALAVAAAPPSNPPPATVASPVEVEVEVEAPLVTLDDRAEQLIDLSEPEPADGDDEPFARVSPVAEALGRSATRPSALSRAMPDDDEDVERAPTDSFTERLRSAVDADDDELGFLVEDQDEPKKRFRRRG